MLFRWRRRTLHRPLWFLLECKAQVVQWEQVRNKNTNLHIDCCMQSPWFLYSRGLIVSFSVSKVCLHTIVMLHHAELRKRNGLPKIESPGAPLQRTISEPTLAESPAQLNQSATSKQLTEPLEPRKSNSLVNISSSSSGTFCLIYSFNQVSFLLSMMMTVWNISQQQTHLLYIVLCSSRKYPYSPPHGRFFVFPPLPPGNSVHPHTLLVKLFLVLKSPPSP